MKEPVSEFTCVGSPCPRMGAAGDLVGSPPEEPGLPALAQLTVEADVRVTRTSQQREGLSLHTGPPAQCPFHLGVGIVLSYPSLHKVNP